MRSHARFSNIASERRFYTFSLDLDDKDQAY